MVLIPKKNSNEIKNGFTSSYEENSLNQFVAKYGGGIIGGLIALILCFTELYKILVSIVIILSGVFIGNYVQKNKSNVKEKLKQFIDRF